MRRRAFGLLFVLFIIILVGGAATVTIMHVAEMTRRRATQITESGARLLLDSGIAYARKHTIDLCSKPSGFELSLPANGLLQAPAKGRLALRVLPDQRVKILADVEFARARASRQTTLPLPRQAPSKTPSTASRTQ